MMWTKSTHLGLGMMMGMAAGAVAVSAAVMACPQGRAMAKKAVRQGKRMMRKYAPMLNG